MARGVKRRRTQTPSPAPSSRESSSSPPLAEPLLTVTHVRPPNRQETKNYLPVTLASENSSTPSEHSDESVHMESSREREDAVLLEGRDLSGDALKSFLQKNFVDFVDHELFDVGALEALED
ncbi:hypothetical protein GH5_04196 [Leishmania sp. Ghana 2012 LV757]|uniref:hypothetical protein n=1 Tax=Leishmania sp. Ghana 2012 LV757 TaxID=2803181 RepID=UPI001B459763|nr:hypothetical protein GH5_04196 [Leishmania sp. Ghana 2012 LV757]